MSDPSLQPKPVTIVLGQSYSLTDLFTFDPGIPPAGDTLLAAQVGFFFPFSGVFSGATELHNDGGIFAIFSVATEQNVAGDFYQYELAGKVSSFGGGEPNPSYIGDFSSGSVIFTSMPVISGAIGFVYATPQYPNGYIEPADDFNYTFNFISSIFSNGSDAVNFNSLLPAQQSAIATGSTFNAGLGGSDSVTLPNEANYNESVGGGKTLGWTDTSASTFYTDSQAGDTYNVSGGDGKYYIVEGAGTEFITITGNGNSNITAGSGLDTINVGGAGNNVITGSTGNYNITLGSGTDAVTITGNGSSNITAGSGVDTININGTGTNVVTAGSGNEILSISGGGTLKVNGTFVGSATIGAASTFELNGVTSGGAITFGGGANATLKIDGTTPVTCAINGMPTDGIIDFANQPGLTLFTSGGEVDLYNGSTLAAKLILSGGVDLNTLEPLNDGKGGTKIVVDPTAVGPPGPQDPSGTQINWSWIHNLESPGGVTQLAPYIPKPGGKSGLTVGQGVDIGDYGNLTSLQNSSSFLTQIFGSTWQNNPNLSFIASLSGASDAQAVAALQPSKLLNKTPFSTAVSLTISQANALTLYTETNLYNQLTQAYTDGAAVYGNLGWNSLNANQQTAIYDVAYNYGLNRPDDWGILDGKNILLWTELTQQDWSAAASTIQDMGGGTSNRRIADAQLLLSGSNVSLNPIVVEPGQSTASNTSYNFSATDTITQYVLDPAGPYLTLVENAGSPQISSLQLPTVDASEYLVSYEIGSSWSTPQIAQAGDLLSFPAGGVNGLTVEMLDNNGNLIQGSPDFAFYLTFASSGTFSANVTSYSGTIVSGGQTYTVSAGQNDFGDVVLNGGIEIVSAGGNASGTTIYSGGILDILFGGSASGATISSGGTVISAYSSSGATVTSGQIYIVSSGQTDVGDVVLSGGTENDYGVTAGTIVAGGREVLYSGGSGSGTTLSNGGAEYVSSGGTASGTTVGRGSIQKVFVSGTAANVTVSSGGTQQVLAGGTASGTHVSSGGFQQDLGSASSTVVSSGGTEYIYSGGTDQGATVNGIQLAWGGGVANGAHINSGGLQQIVGSASGTVLSGGTLEIVYSGGTDQNATVNGTQQVWSGGATSGAHINSGGLLQDLGSASGTVVAAGGTEVVYPGGTDQGATVNGILLAWGGGTLNGAHINSGGLQQVVGSASGTVISAGGLEIVYSGGIDQNATVNGTQQIWAGGAASGAHINSGGVQQDLGSISGTVVSAGGTEVVYSGGTDQGATVNGIQLMWGGGTANGAHINSGGLQQVVGSASGTVLSGGALEIVYSGGTDSGTIINNSGTQQIWAGGIANGAHINSGGLQQDLGSASGTVLSNGGIEIVYAGGVASGSIVGSGSNEVVSGTDSGATINGGTQYDYTTANGASVLSGGFQIVVAGASASGTTVSSGGEEFVALGGNASAVKIASDGIEVVHGTDSGATISGGTQYDFGVANGGTVVSGGEQVVEAGASASATHVNSGGLEYVASGGVASGATISGGTLEIASGGSTGSAPVTFALSAGGTLQLDDSVHFGGLVAGFGLPDALDLRDIAFISGTTTSNFVEAGNNLSGTLTITTSGTTANITLLGQYVAGQFHLTSDGHGGTLVTDPPLTLTVAADQQSFLTQPRHV